MAEPQLKPQLVRCVGREGTDHVRKDRWEMSAFLCRSSQGQERVINSRLVMWMVLGKRAERASWESWTLPWESALTGLQLVFLSLSHKPLEWGGRGKDRKYIDRVRGAAALAVCLQCQE